MESLCFNNCNIQTNGELWFYKTYIEKNCSLVFDVGSRDDTLFGSFEGEVHYFEPDPLSLQKLFGKIKNKRSFLNNFGLSDKEETITYYKEHQSFLDRKITQPHVTLGDPIQLHVKRGDAYCLEKNIETIDFLKVDTEGYEMKVLQGFGDYLKKVRILQFEYGGTFKDSGVRLVDIIQLCRQNGFSSFYYLTYGSLYEIPSYEDHYQYCNIVCFRD
jgi:FkbM family methyltransferase